MSNEPKPTLNNATLQSFGSYVAVYDIQTVDEKQKLFKGRPVPFRSTSSPLPSQNNIAEWFFFTGEYDDRNDWDRLYHEYSFDESLIGQPFKMIPKEKLLFKYDAPTFLAMPDLGIKFGGR